MYLAPSKLNVLTFYVDYKASRKVNDVSGHHGRISHCIKLFVPSLSAFSTGLSTFAYLESEASWMLC